MEQAIYRSYLLRLWQVEENGSRVWRASLEETGTGKRIAFAKLEELWRYLAAETAANQREQEEETS